MLNLIVPSFGRIHELSSGLFVRDLSTVYPLYNQSRELFAFVPLAGTGWCCDKPIITQVHLESMKFDRWPLYVYPEFPIKSS